MTTRHSQNAGGGRGYEGHCRLLLSPGQATRAPQPPVYSWCKAFVGHPNHATDFPSGTCLNVNNTNRLVDASTIIYQI